VKILHPRTILLGHSLNSDLTALKLTHPFIIDTAVIYPHPRGPPLKSSLKYLAQRYLGREIQKGHGTTGPGAGHDSVEDARTCLDLLKQKCEKGKDWGTGDAQGENFFKRIARAGVKYKNQGGSAIPSPMNGKSSAIADWGEPKRGAGSAATFAIGCKSDEEVTNSVIRAVKGDPAAEEIPSGGVDFVFGRLRELEALKGWWNNNKQAAAEAALKDKIALSAQNTDKERKVETLLETPLATTEAAQKEPGKPPIASGPAKEDFEVATETKAPNGSAVEAIAAHSETLDPPANALSSSLTNSLPPPTTDALDRNTPISTAVTSLVSRIQKIYDSLPPCTAFIVFSGSGDPREMSKLHAMQAQFKREYKIKKWDELSVKWTDVEEQALKKATREARQGIAFIGVK
jgi:RNA exonuclease 1